MNTLISIRRGLVASLVDGAIIRLTADGMKESIQLPIGVAAGDVVAICCELPSIATKAGVFYVAVGGGWSAGLPGAFTPPEPAAPPRPPRKIEVPARSAQEATEPRIWVTAQKSMGLGVTVCEVGDRLHVHVPLGRELCGNNSALAADEAAANALRTGGVLTTANAR